MTSETVDVFKMVPTKDIGSTPALIFGSETTCVIDGLILANQMDDPVLCSLYLLRELADPTPQEAIQYPLATNVLLGPQESLDWMKSKVYYTEPGDLLFAYSNYWNNLFNTFVSYRSYSSLPV